MATVEIWEKFPSISFLKASAIFSASHRIWASSRSNVLAAFS